MENAEKAIIPIRVEIRALGQVVARWGRRERW